MNTDEEPLHIDLDEQERWLLAAGLNEWGGPAHPTEEMAYAMGFDNIKDIYVQDKRLYPAIMSGVPLTPFDWSRALLATEIVFASAIVGAAGDWSIVTGRSDEETLVVLRRLQTKLMRSGIRTAIGTTPRKRHLPSFWTPPPIGKAEAASLAGVSIRQLDEWEQGGLLQNRPMRQPDATLWWFGLVVEATVARHLVTAGVSTASMVRALRGTAHTEFIWVRGNEAFNVNIAVDVLPAEPVMVLDIAAVADELRQRWPTPPVPYSQPRPATWPPRPGLQK